MTCYAYAPAPSFALITFTIWPDFLIAPRCPKQDAAVLSPRVQKIRRETSEYRHGRKGFNFPQKINGVESVWPCVVAPHICEVDA